MCIPKGHKEFYHIDTSQALKGTAQVEKSLSVKGAVGAALFGFVDGFLSGMASEMRTAFEDPKCNSGNVKTKLQNVVHKFKAMWHQMKQLHKKTWTSQGRKDIIKSIKEFISSLLDFLKEGMKYMWECPATKTIVIMVGMIAVMLLLNMAFIAGGYVVIPLIIKYVGMIMGLYFSFTYMAKKVMSLARGTKKMIQRKCTDDCKISLIEDTFGMIGAITEIIVISGLDDVMSIKKDASQPLVEILS